MRKLYLNAALAAAFLFVIRAGLTGAPQKPVVKYFSVPVTMRDGVRLYANVYLPSENHRLPALLVRTPYGKGTDITQHYQAFVDHGYAVVVQDVRGRYESEGAFQPLTQETADGDDTLNWVARQPWSNGKIGMMGGSYVGIVQWKAALANNPHLKAIFPVVSGYDDYRDRYYSTGGAMKLGNRLEWMSENMRAPGYHQDFSKFVLHLPVRSSDIAALGWTSPMYQDIIQHPTFDSFWRAISTKEHLDRVKVPVFAVGGWYDNFVQSDLEAYAARRKSNGLSRVLVGPWAHNMSVPFEGVDFGQESNVPIRQLQLEWFDQFLMGKDTPLLSQPPAKIFVMGANKWREETSWPPEEARTKVFYLASGGNANSLSGDGSLADGPARKTAADRFVFDPYAPVPTRGGAVCCNPKIFPWGPIDQRGVESRKDVLVYSTKPLKHDVEAIGPVQAVLYVASSARDTDFTAKLVDVFPDGTARNLTDGILRLRYRNSLEKPELAKPGEIYRVTVDAGVTSNVFQRGHRIRIEISSSNFPRFDRNANTGGPVELAARLVKANQTIYHDPAHPSCLVLKVMP